MTLDWVNGAPETLRLAYAAERAPLDATAPPDVSVEHVAGALNGLHFTPAGGGAGAPILYFHGGSWLLGSPETHRALCAWLAKLSDRRVVSVRYPLAPEHRYPAQRDAARAALAAMVAAESGPVFVAGDSAGGAMAIWAAGSDRAQVAGVAAFYPAYGLLHSASIDAYGPGNAALNAASIAAMYARLGCAPGQVQRDCARDGAPLLILAAGRDPLRDDALALAADMEAESQAQDQGGRTGRDVTLWTAEDQEHAFLHHGGSDPVVQAWIGRVGDWMRAVEGRA